MVGRWVGGDSVLIRDKSEQRKPHGVNKEHNGETKFDLCIFKKKKIVNSVSIAPFDRLYMPRSCFRFSCVSREDGQLTENL